ncbi:MAG: HTH-type transcriptional repressor CzrA [Betaproteobacteria bacterium ADurb.Bin341]|nr:MAG: HTH-type transcriptional repressor CzrA [Betaproteobacteria bacterium ADurb.Bin341]
MQNFLYEYVAQIGKAVSNPKRLELLELMMQGEKPVEMLAEQTGIDVRLASAHLRCLREARLVETRREGKYVYYRLSGPDVAQLCHALRETAEAHLVELRLALEQMQQAPDGLFPQDRESLLQKARDGEVIVIDVRPGSEYAAGHFPFARSLPLEELEQRLAELPSNAPVVAYCRGPYCLMSDEAVRLLRKHGYEAAKWSGGMSDWCGKGLPVETSCTY